MSHGIKWMVQGMVLVFLLGLMASPAMADKIRDFKKALDNSGCKAIPYSSLSNRCRTKQDQVKRWCKNDQAKKGCKSFEPETSTDRGLKNKFKDVIKKLENCIEYREEVQDIFKDATRKVKGESNKDLKKFSERLKDKLESGHDGHQTEIRNTKDKLDTCKDKQRIFQRR